MHYLHYTFALAVACITHTAMCNFTQSFGVIPSFDRLCHACHPFARYHPCSEGGPGVEFGWPENDRTLVQIDHASITPESTQIETLTIYRLLVLLEKTKKISQYKVTYSECKRTDAATGNDGFQLTISEAHYYKCIVDPKAKLSCKSFFAGCLDQVKNSSTLRSVFRFRFERVHGTVKVQKPYVILRCAVDFEAGQVVQCS